MSIRAVTFDAAGTLITLAEPVGVTYARIAARHGITLDVQALELSFRAAFAAAPPLAFPGASPTQLAAHERAWWYAVVRRAFGAAAHEPGFDACFAELYALYAHADAWRVFPDVPDVLDALRAGGIALAVVSNFDGRLPGVLAALGLAARVDTIVYSARAGAAKPDPAIFHEALRRLGRGSDEALHVGDSVHVDVAGARAAGLTPVLLERGRRVLQPPSGVRMIHTIAYLPALLTLF